MGTGKQNGSRVLLKAGKDSGNHELKGPGEPGRDCRVGTMHESHGENEEIQWLRAEAQGPQRT